MMIEKNAIIQICLPNFIQFCDLKGAYNIVGTNYELETAFKNQSRFVLYMYINMLWYTYIYSR